MKKRTLLLIVTLLLALAASLGATLAYLTDTDSDVNVMTLGNVDIKQMENGEEGFHQSQPLYPAYYTDEPDASAVGAVEKRVNVENIGTSDAYIRTVFAFEAGDLTKEEFEQNIHLLWNDIEADVKWAAEKVTIKDEQYFLAWYTYPAAVPANTETAETLMGIVMDKDADNDVMAKLGDDEYKILVVSQASQTSNFDALYATDGAEGVLNQVFGELSAASNPWLDMNGVADEDGDQAPDAIVIVYTDDELIAAIENGAEHIMLGADIELSDPSKFMYTSSSGASLYIHHKDLTLNLNGHDLIVPEEALMNGKTYANGALLVHYSTLNIMGEGSIRTENQSIAVYGWAHANANIYGGTYTSNASNRNESVVYVNNPNVMIHVYGGDFTGCDYAFNAHDKNCGSTAVITLHEGIEFKQFFKSGNDLFMSDMNAGRIVLAADCELQTSTVDGVVWYKVVKK